jgi:Ca2+-dependent lipid-binding protein
LRCQVLGGRGLAKMDRGKNGAADPYVVVSCSGVETTHKTSIVKGSLEPRWDQAEGGAPSFEFDAVPAAEGAMLRLDVWDDDKISKSDAMGRVELPLAALIGNSNTASWQALGPMEGSNAAPQGELEIVCTVVAQKEGADGHAE